MNGGQGKQARLTVHPKRNKVVNREYIRNQKGMLIFRK